MRNIKKKLKALLYKADQKQPLTKKECLDACKALDWSLVDYILTPGSDQLAVHMRHWPDVIGFPVNCPPEEQSTIMLEHVAWWPFLQTLSKLTKAVQGLSSTSASGAASGATLTQQDLDQYLGQLHRELAPILKAEAQKPEYAMQAKHLVELLRNNATTLLNKEQQKLDSTTSHFAQPVKVKGQRPKSLAADASQNVGSQRTLTANELQAYYESHNAGHGR